MSTLICGSFAYDNIMVFEDRFKNHILADQVHILNVCFLVPRMRREFGGCAGNIAYNLKLLGGDPLPMGTVGEDFRPYEEWLDRCGIDRRYVTKIENRFTAQAYITTDLDDNQITAFHPGAMNEAHANEVPDNNAIRLGIISPDGGQAMLEHARQLVDRDIPFIFDPGQQIPVFDGDKLNDFIRQATYLTVNDYEAELIQERTQRTRESIAADLKALIVTKGGEGSEIYTKGQRLIIPATRISGVVDPTGCGDAYRAGLLYGIVKGLDWETTGRIASLMGGIKIESHGTQNHRVTRSELEARFEENFGYQLAA
ncbi:MAG: carbohydrate kinase family protein [Arenicellales bacterium]|nr:carbohydrate kinase family protein [Arenicellales bacterium]